jgi:hypothetical protein
MDLSIVVSALSVLIAVDALFISISSARSARRWAVANEGVQRVEEARRRDEIEAAHDRLGPGYPGPLRFFLKALRSRTCPQPSGSRVRDHGKGRNTFCLSGNPVVTSTPRTTVRVDVLLSGVWFSETPRGSSDACRETF